ncbi:MAG TPA: amidohydrolase family protein [Acidimicrobiales bacterium]|nr:amidohydrolase family protein [Acidimicrobiales bacterium]
MTPVTATGRSAPAQAAPAQTDPGRSGLLPDPEPRPVHYTVISVDDHLVEPADLFDGRLPARYADRAPRVVEGPGGVQQWVYEDEVFPQLGLNAVAGRPPDAGEHSSEPLRFEEMRPGCYRIDDRIRDMDLNGVWASVNFPSMITGFAGTVYSRSTDRELGLAVMRAWNDWLFEEWYGPYPERIVPMGITWLADPALAAAEVRRNAERGFRAVSLPEMPHRIGYPSLHTGYWDPVIEACVETGTVVCLHVGSSGLFERAEGAPGSVSGTLFGSLSLTACVDWLWSGLPVRYPTVKIAMSEGGIGWVPMLRDRLDYVMGRAAFGRVDWMSDELLPSEVLRRNFWFCTIDDPSTLPCLDSIGVDRVMVEVDYPHGDSTWPDTQAILHDRLGGLPVDVVRKLTHRNAAELFRHPLPPEPLP